MKEIWKDIKGFEGLYKVSNLGRLYSYPRRGTKGGYTYGGKLGENYLICALYKYKIKTYVLMHRLVYETFVGPIPEGYDVHHIDHNPKNNSLDNLQLLPSSEHSMKHLAEHSKKTVAEAIKTTSKPILQYTLDGELVAEYPSACEAARKNGISQSSITACLKGRTRTAGKFKWEYKK